MLTVEVDEEVLRRGPDRDLTDPLCVLALIGGGFALAFCKSASPLKCTRSLDVRALPWMMSALGLRFYENVLTSFILRGAFFWILIIL